MTSNLAARLQQALAASDHTAASLARAARTTDATISNWLRDGGVQQEQAKGALALRIAQALGVRADWLLLGEGAPQGDTVRVADGEIGAGYLRLPQIDLPAGAGPGVEIDMEPDVVRWVDVAESWADANFGRKTPAIRIMSARGDSMVGAGINSGDLLFVDVSVQRYDGDGFYILQFMEGWQVKRLRADILTQQVEIVSVTTNGEDVRQVPPERLPELRVGGKVSAWWTLRKH